MSNSNDRKLIVVTGATGQQGGSLVRVLLTDNRYRVRAITRNPQSAKAQQLAAQGVEVYQADLNSSVDELARAFQGAHGVFGVTNFWDPGVFMVDSKIEIKQGKNIVDAAARAGVKHLVFSSLDDVDFHSEGKIDVPHFTNKHIVERYARAVKLRLGDKQIVTFAYPGFYFSNLRTFFPLQSQADGSYSLALSVPGNTTVPIVDIEADCGPIVKAIFDGGQIYDQRAVYIAGEYISFDDICKTLGQVNNKRIEYKQIDHEAYAKAANKELDEMLLWFERFGYYNGADISTTRSIHPGVRNFRQALDASGWRL